VSRRWDAARRQRWSGWRRALGNWMRLLRALPPLSTFRKAASCLLCWRSWSADCCGILQSTFTLVWGTSRAMYEEVHFDENMVTSVDWLTYRVIKMDGVPESIEIVLINRPEEPPSGAAEMACGPLPAAIANAVFDATGGCGACPLRPSG
jgi:hypothetical protein